MDIDKIKPYTRLHHSQVCCGMQGEQKPVWAVWQGAPWINQSSGAKYSYYYSVFAGMYYIYYWL